MTLCMVISMCKRASAQMVQQIFARNKLRMVKYENNPRHIGTNRLPMFVGLLRNRNEYYVKGNLVIDITARILNKDVTSWM